MRDVKEPEVRRAEIMEAALFLFMQKGYMNTTTQDIIDKVKISRGLLYYHFKNKEDILYCLVERYSEPLLQNLSTIFYDKEKSAIEKVRSFIEVTLVSPEAVTSEMVELQKTVDLEQNRYMMDRFSHNLIEKVTVYFAGIIEQGVLEKVFFVEYPKETAYFLMTGYVFTSNNMNVSHEDTEKANHYLRAFKILLARTLGTDMSIFNN
jgi:Transcriptional regulator